MVVVTDIIPDVIQALFEAVNAANDVFFKENLSELSSNLLRIIAILEELSKKNIGQSQALDDAVNILNREAGVFKELVVECSKSNRVYQFVKYRSIAKRIEDIKKEIVHALSLMSVASLDVSSNISEDVKQLHDSMEVAEFKTALAYDDILDKIDAGIQERNIDHANAYKLALLIGDAVGISTQAALKEEFEGFKTEIENAKLNKDQSETIQLEQIIALLVRGDATSCFEEKKAKYISKRNSLGTQPLEALQSFYCPITREVMEDPVETSSGQTFERKAIEGWLASGTNLCPMTNIVLETHVLRPNITLRQSIEEWKERNTIILIASMRTKLYSSDAEEILCCLVQLQDLCEKRYIHREWVILENYIPVLLELLRAENRDVRNCSIVILHILAKDSDDTKERIARTGGALESIVRSLGRRNGNLAVALLLELSKSDSVRQSIGNIKGCIIYLVTMANSTDVHAARDARQLLQSLSFSDHNVIQMAKTNYFKHLLERLSSGPADVKVTMAATLAEMELSDHYKSSLLEQGVLNPLIQLVTEGDDQMKEVAVKALRSLSSLPGNSWHMIRQGSVGTLLRLLYHPSSSSNLREQAAATIMHLAISTTHENTSGTLVTFFESDEEISTLFSCINLTVHELQESILRSFQALCQSPSASNVMRKLNESTSIQVLLQLCELDNQNVRMNAVKLLYCLVQDGIAENIIELLDQKSTETITKIIMTSDDSEEIASAMGIISNLPVSPQISDWILESGGLSKILDHLSDGKHNSAHKNILTENALATICLVTTPENHQLQKKAAEIGIIHVLVKLLEQGTSLTKKRAATALAQFSKSTPMLTREIPKRHIICCFSTQPDTGCPVHKGICTVESSFCLVEAGAVSSLVRLLVEPDIGTCEASLDALLTLVEGARLKSGSKVLDEAKAIPCIIKLLNVTSPALQEKVLNLLERIFEIQELREKHGGSSQMLLVELTQRGKNSIKSSAARILGQLNVLHDQSSYF